VTSTLSRHKSNIGSAHIFAELNIWVMFEENSSISIGLIERTNQFLTSSVTLTLSRHIGNMGSAHNLVELNIWVKLFEENSSISIGFIERTRHIVYYLIVCNLKTIKRGITLEKCNTELWNLTCISLLWHFIYMLSFKQILFLVSEIYIQIIVKI